MRLTRRIAVAALLATGAASGACAQTAAKHKDSTKSKHKEAKPTIATLQREMEEMHNQLQSEIDLLKQQLERRDAQLAAAQDSAASAQQQAATAAAQTQAVASSVEQNTTTVSNLQTTVQQTQAANEQVAAQVQTVASDTKAIRKAVEEPTAIHYKGITLTPGGFIAGESIWRQRAMNADLFTNFNSTPYPNAGEAHTTEWVPSARGSRLSLLASGDVPFGTISGYFEGDFLGAGSTSNNLQTNSYVLRTRQAWAQVKTKRITFTGGEMWTLLTEIRRLRSRGRRRCHLPSTTTTTLGSPTCASQGSGCKRPSRHR